jgi:predicted nucleotidyltransferase component of viral defense system
MIPQAYITEWSNHSPWTTREQIEQDLVICRALVQIFSDESLAFALAFRGGTALHKLFLCPASRYSEDIDLVQIRPEPIKKTVERLQESISFLGKSAVNPKRDGFQILLRFDSEYLPVQRMRLKVEVNTREHFNVMGLQIFPFEVISSWFKGNCTLTTYHLEELLGTKLRALYQRRKGRDLYDLARSLNCCPDIDRNLLLKCYHTYMTFSVEKPPTQKQFLMNMETKIQDPEFIGDTKLLLRPNENYDHLAAYELVKTELIERI